MDLIGSKVLHATFGEGVILHQENGYVRVAFNAACGEKKFVYPDAFAGFLTIVDQERSRMIQLDLCEKKRLESEKRTRQMEKLQEIQEKLIAEKNAGKCPGLMPPEKSNRPRNKSKERALLRLVASTRGISAL